MRVWMKFCSFAVICFLVYVRFGQASQKIEVAAT